jgi:hypothetical protein
MSPPLCRFLSLVADADESASCDGGLHYAYPPYGG